MLATKDERQHFIDTMLVPDLGSGKYKFDVLVTSYEGILKAKVQLAKVNMAYHEQYRVFVPLDL
jgi:hypothetical protein